MPEVHFKLATIAEKFGYGLTVLEHTPSTNSDALQQAQSLFADNQHLRQISGQDLKIEPIWFVSDDQRQGRGRRGRAWQGVKGNLAASLLLINDFSAAQAASLGFVCGLSMVEALEHVARQVQAPMIDFRVKWPNDCLANNAKLSGTLLERVELDGPYSALVLGTGVNIVAHPDDTPYPATNLQQLGMMTSATQIFEAFSHFWCENYLLWSKQDGLRLIAEKWRAKAWNLGQPISILVNNERHDGIFENLDEQFQLILKQQDNTRLAIAAGDVHFGNIAAIKE